MRAHLWTAIQEMLDAAEYAIPVLDRYADTFDGDHGQPEPNGAMCSASYLRDAMETLQKQMEQETPK